MGYKRKIGILAVLAIGAILLFLFYDLNHWEYVFPRRATKVLAITITGSAIALSTVVFQTITNNRILTPSIIGFDSLYLLIQTFIIFVFGSMSALALNQHVNFAISALLMIAFAMLLYKFLFRGETQNLYFLLLVGIVLGTFFSSMSTFMQVLIDPNEFMSVQSRMFASFNNVNTDLLIISILVLLVVIIFVARNVKYLDVISLGRDQAINLGVPYEKIVRQLLTAVAILVSISTALVGPITFLGLLVANVAYEFLKTHKHKYIIIGAMLLGVVSLVFGQFVVERVFTFATTISVIVNFIGGVYFLYLLLKGR